MIKLKKILTAILVITLAISFSTFFTPGAAESDSTTIWAPRGTNPTFALPGDTIKVEVQSSAKLSATGWTAKLHNNLREWNAQIESVKAGKVRFGLEDGYIFSITIPQNISLELFTLVLTDSKGNTVTSSRCVNVVKSFDNDFYILHITDEHVTTGRPTLEGGKSSSGTSSIEMKYWVAPTINLINPRFVQYSGDNIQQYYGGSGWAGYGMGVYTLKAYLDSLNEYTVPTLLVTGNHDIGYAGYENKTPGHESEPNNNYPGNTQWRQKYDEMVGRRAFSIKMGSFYVLNYEWTIDDYFEWAKNDYLASFQDSTITYRLVASHSVGYDGPRNNEVIVSQDKTCNLQIVGHGHTTTTLQTIPWPILETGSAQNGNTSGFFNFVRNGNSWSCPQTTSRSNDTDYFKLFTSNDGSDQRVSVSFEKKNDGTATSNSATVTNKIKQRFYDGRVRFLMKRGVYSVNGGEIVSQYDFGTDKTAVVVKVDIKAATTSASNVNLTINKTGESNGTVYPDPTETGTESQDESSSVVSASQSSSHPGSSSSAIGTTSQSSTQEPSSSDSILSSDESIQGTGNSQVDSQTDESLDPSSSPKENKGNMWPIITIIIAASVAVLAGLGFTIYIYKFKHK